MRLIFALLFAALSFRIHAQSVKPDSVWYEKKRFRYVSIQCNPLLQQFISFNSNASINNNPYLLTFATNNPRTGGGFTFGTGFSVNQSSTNDGVASVTQENVNVSVRVGGEKKYLQKTKFIPFWGIDMGMGVVYNKTSSTLNQSFNNTSSAIETSRYFFGPALRGGLDYRLSRNILIGTEFFFNAQIAYTETKTFNAGFFTTATTTTPFNVGIQAPTALFLIFRY